MLTEAMFCLEMGLYCYLESRWPLHWFLSVKHCVFLRINKNSINFLDQ